MNSEKFCCDNCKDMHKFRKLTRFKGKFLCRKCMTNQELDKISKMIINNRKKTCIEEAVKKIYKIYTYKSRGSEYCRLSLPSCFKNKKVKLVVQ